MTLDQAKSAQVEHAIAVLLDVAKNDLSKELPGLEQILEVVSESVRAHLPPKAASGFAAGGYLPGSPPGSGAATTGIIHASTSPSAAIDQHIAATIQKKAWSRAMRGMR